MTLPSAIPKEGLQIRSSELGPAVFRTRSSVPRTFVLHSSWQPQRPQLRRTATATAELQDSSDEESDDEIEDQPTKLARCLESISETGSKLLIDPNSKGKVIWDFIAFILVLYDCIMIPASLLDVYVAEVSWITRLFWTADIPASMFTTFPLHNGKLETKLWSVCRLRIKSIVLKDIPLVAIDWTDYALGSLGAAKLGKLVKAVRLIRLLRLWRLVNAKELPESLRAGIHYCSSSEVGITVINILKLLGIVIWANHILACCWYAIAEQAEDREVNWIRANHLSDKSTLYVYLTAVHWSLSQFICGSMEVVPTNVDERSFAVSVIIGTIMLSAFIISTLTASMTRLTIAAAAETQKFAVLRDFLTQNNISARVALRVQRNARNAFKDLKRRTPETEVELLALVSQPLRIELHYEMNMPWLRKHPFFDAYCEESPELLRQVCHAAVTSLSIAEGDLLFSEDVTNVQQMYFLVMGKLMYVQADLKGPFGGTTRSPVNVGDWISEGAIWTTWSHCGSMRAKAESQLMLLSSEIMQSIASNFKSALPFASRYARMYLAWLNQLPCEDLTDLAHPSCDYLAMSEACRTQDGPADLQLKPRRLTALVASLRRGSMFSGDSPPSNDVADAQPQVPQTHLTPAYKPKGFVRASIVSMLKS